MTGTETTKCFADRLQDLIAESGKDVKTLADEIGVSSGALSKYQNDKGEPGISALYKIANYFGVTADYLIGLSDNKTVENASIGQVTGLSDDAIVQLKKKRHNRFYTIALSSLIVEHNCLSLLVNYLFSFLPYEITKTYYNLIPKKKETPKYYKDICFSALIRFLPVRAEQLKLEIINDNNILDVLMLEYLYKNANITACKATLWGVDNEYIPDFFPDNDTGYSDYDFNTDDEEPDETLLIEEEKVKDIFYKVIKYFDARKEGDINADNTEEE